MVVEKADQKQLSAILEDISTAARERRWESSRSGEGGGGMELAESGAGSDVTRYTGMETGDAQVGK